MRSEPAFLFRPCQTIDTLPAFQASAPDALQIILPPQQNLWVHSGSGKFPSV